MGLLTGVGLLNFNFFVFSIDLNKPMGLLNLTTCENFGRNPSGEKSILNVSPQIRNTIPIGMKRNRMRMMISESSIIIS